MKGSIRDLFEQFKLSLGLHDITVNDINKNKKLSSAFYEWIQKRIVLCNGFTKILDEEGINYKDETCAEVGKGIYDSIVIPYDSFILSKHADEFTSCDASRLIRGYLEINDFGFPNIINNDKLMVSNVKDSFETFLTFNPYTISDIRDWDKIYNSNNGNIIIGVFGNSSDRDKEQKIYYVRSIKSKLQYGYNETYASQDGNYYYVVETQSEKSRTRSMKR